MKKRKSLSFLLPIAVMLIGARSASAQTIGTFRWQLQPYCNVLQLTVAVQGGVYTLDGFDDQCGAGQRGSVTGTAFPNPDGSVGIGLATALAPGGTSVHTNVRLDLSSLGGPWQDSAGNGGTLVFVPGGGLGGPVRPVPSSGLPAASVTTVQIAPGAVGAGQVNPSQVQMRVSGTCPQGGVLRSINPDGSVECVAGISVSTHVFQPGGITWNQKTLFSTLYREAELSVPELTAAVIANASVQVFGAFNFGQPWTPVPVTYLESGAIKMWFYSVKTGAVVVRISQSTNTDPIGAFIALKVVIVRP